VTTTQVVTMATNLIVKARVMEGPVAQKKKLLKLKVC